MQHAYVSTHRIAVRNRIQEVYGCALRPANAQPPRLYEEIQSATHKFKGDNQWQKALCS